MPNQLCRDLDECSLGTHQCHKDATCYNKQGSYICRCKSQGVRLFLQLGQIWYALVTSLLVDIWETDFSVKMLMNASLVVFINVTMMQIVWIMMVHMTVNVKLVFMVMAISIVFMMNYAKSKNVMKMRIVNHLKAWFTERDIARSVVDRFPV